MVVCGKRLFFTQLSTRNYKAELHFLKIRSLLRLRKLQARKCTGKLAGESAIVQTVSLGKSLQRPALKAEKNETLETFKFMSQYKGSSSIYIGRPGVTLPGLYTVQLYLFSVQDMSATYNSSKCHIRYSSPCIRAARDSNIKNISASYVLQGTAEKKKNLTIL